MNRMYQDFKLNAGATYSIHSKVKLHLYPSRQAQRNSPSMQASSAGLASRKESFLRLSALTLVTTAKAVRVWARETNFMMMMMMM